MPTAEPAALEKVRRLLDPTLTVGEAEREETPRPPPTLSPPYTREPVGTGGKAAGPELLEIVGYGR